MTTAQLEPVQTAAERFQRLVVLIVVLALVLLILAVVVSVNRRRTVVQLGIAVAAGLLLAALAIRKIKDSVVGGLSNPAGRGAAREVLDTMIGSLRTLILWVGAIALLAALIAYLLGRPVLAREGHRLGEARGRGDAGGSPLARWTAAHADALRIGGIVVAILLLLVIGFGWISFLVIARAARAVHLGRRSADVRARPWTMPLPPGDGAVTDTARSRCPGPAVPTEEIRTADA